MKSFKKYYRYKNFYDINLNKTKNLFSIFGFKYIKNYDNNMNNNINIEQFNNFLSVNVNKKEILKKQKKEKIKKKIDNGSYSGYKYFRGLPSKNQRTKTNAKTSKKKQI